MLEKLKKSNTHLWKIEKCIKTDMLTYEQTTLICLNLELQLLPITQRCKITIFTSNMPIGNNIYSSPW